MQDIFGLESLLEMIVVLSVANIVVITLLAGINIANWIKRRFRTE